jgi:hypothetical protein
MTGAAFAIPQSEMSDRIFQNGDAIGVVRPETFSEDTAQTPRSHKVAAIAREHGTSSGDFVYVPAYPRHKEIQLSQDTEFTWVVVRSTQPIVANLPDMYGSGGRGERNN